LVVIGHGVDWQTFAPLVYSETGPDHRASRRLARELLFPDRPELHDAFIVLNANRNTGRKRLDLTLAGFAEFSRGRGDDVWLYLHAGMRDFGCDLRREARRLGIEERVLVTHVGNEHPRVSDARLRLIYNACDVGVNTSSGEGWGLPAFEHAATGAAQIMPRHGSCEQLWGDAATLLETVALPPTAHTLFTPNLIAPADLAAALARLHDDKDFLEASSVRAYRRATSPELSWDAIADQWDRLFWELVPTATPRPGHAPPAATATRIDSDPTRRRPDHVARERLGPGGRPASRLDPGRDSRLLDAGTHGRRQTG
jgi:glycosyltransferase involved in cell wall biosynthesis